MDPISYILRTDSKTKFYGRITKQLDEDKVIFECFMLSNFNLLTLNRSEVFWDYPKPNVFGNWTDLLFEHIKFLKSISISIGDDIVLEKYPLGAHNAEVRYFPFWDEKMASIYKGPEKIYVKYGNTFVWEGLDYSDFEYVKIPKQDIGGDWTLKEKVKKEDLICQR